VLADFQEEVRVTTFVPIPGAWLGGWCWKHVVPLLCDEGHEVYTLTLATHRLLLRLKSDE
jgi:hypothetical protein